MATHKESRSRLVSGCGTILKTDRLKGGYELVKRKRTAKETTSATGKKRQATKKAQMTASAPVSAPVSAPKKGGGRPKGSKNKPKTTTMMSAPAKTSKTRKSKVNAFFQAKANAIKSGAKSFVYGGQKYVATKTKTGMTIFKKAGKNTAMKNTTVMTTSTAPKSKVGRPKGSKNKPKMARRAKKTMA